MRMRKSNRLSLGGFPEPRGRPGYREVFDHHDRARFEIVGVSWGADDASEMRARFKQAFARFINVEPEGDGQVARLLRDMEIDIAVDLMGFTAECRTGIFASRAAPIQVNYLGFPGTMNAPYMDYLVADRMVIPQGERRHYGETIIYLPDTYLPARFEAPHRRGHPRRAGRIARAGFVFASFNNSYKFSLRCSASGYSCSKG